MAIGDRAGEFEARYAHDQELRFRVETRARRILGRWAAGKLGIDAENYAEDLVQLGLAGASESEIHARIRRDFDAAGVSQSDHRIDRHAEQALAEAREEVSRA